MLLTITQSYNVDLILSLLTERSASHSSNVYTRREFFTGPHTRGTCLCSRDRSLHLATHARWNTPASELLTLGDLNFRLTLFCVLLSCGGRKGSCTCFIGASIGVDSRFYVQYVSLCRERLVN